MHPPSQLVLCSIQAAPSAQFFFSSFPPARSTSYWQGMFFIYFRVISHEFVLSSLRKPCGFFPCFFMGIPLILFLYQNCFISAV